MIERAINHCDKAPNGGVTHAQPTGRQGDGPAGQMGTYVYREQELPVDMVRLRSDIVLLSLSVQVSIRLSADNMIFISIFHRSKFVGMMSFSILLCLNKG